jgi:hypothetical protein
MLSVITLADTDLQQSIWLLASGGGGMSTDFYTAEKARDLLGKSFV